MSKLAVGRFGEKAACIFLRNKGYLILERNWHCRYGEIDIVAKKNGRIVFVEVKTRSPFGYGNYKDHVTTAKLRRLYLSTNLYLCSRRLYDVAWRLDGIYIIKDCWKLHFQHLQGILEDRDPGMS